MGNRVTGVEFLVNEIGYCSLYLFGVNRRGILVRES